MFLSIGKDSTNWAKCKINKAKITHKPHITQKRADAFTPAPVFGFYISSIDSPLYWMSYFLNACVPCSITSARCFNTPMLISSAWRLIS